MIIGIDASNLARGGGVTHLAELISAASPESHGIRKVVVWGRASVLDCLPDRDWLCRQSDPGFDKGLLWRTYWQRFILPREVRRAGCDLLFAPGGNAGVLFRPVVTMSRNMLPFAWNELRRYGVSMTFFRLLLLRWMHAASIRNADGVIFLTRHAEGEVKKVTGPLHNSTVTIPHGINDRFRIAPREQRLIESCTDTRPFRLIYVSIIDVYKHQWTVVEAVAELRRRTGWPVVLDMVGPAYAPALERLESAIARFDAEGRWAHYHGSMPYDDLHEIYGRSDLGVFASSCENMPNILVEKMSAGLPIASSNRGPMPEILGDAGAYFDPTNANSIADALGRLIASRDDRIRLAEGAYRAARQYSWTQCADRTFAFLSTIAETRAGKPCAA